MFQEDLCFNSGLKTDLESKFAVVTSELFLMVCQCQDLRICWKFANVCEVIFHNYGQELEVLKDSMFFLGYYCFYKILFW